MSKGIPFIKLYKLGAELGAYPPFIIREAIKISDYSRVIVKIFCKLGQSSNELDKIQNELQFWRLVSFPQIVPLEQVYDEEGFVYMLYEYPKGGDLAALLMDPMRTFSEGFAKKIAIQMLDALSFLHSNGIVHGGLIPSNIIFLISTEVPGWTDSAKLSFFRIDSSRETSIFTDIQDLAFSICCIMRKKAGLLSRMFFHPDVLQSNRDWDHLTDEMVDFIGQLWTAKDFNKCSENFLSHPWLESITGRGDKSGAIPKPFQLSAIHYQGTSLPASKSFASQSSRAIKNVVYVKMREKTKMGTRKWRRYFGVLHEYILLLYMQEDEDRSQNQRLARAVHLRDKTVVVTSAATHDFTFGLQDTILQQVVLWLRFDNEALYMQWKYYLLSLESKLTDSQPLAPAVVSDSMSTTNSANQKDIQSFAAEFAASLAKSSESEAKADANDKDLGLLAAEALVKAVDEASRHMTRQIEVQTNAYIRKSGFLQLLRSGELDNVPTRQSYAHTLSPFPSDSKTRTHPAARWDQRVTELMTVMSTGTPVNTPVLKGQTWFVIDATWFKHWIYFVSSSRRTAPPGPIDNLWMVNPSTDRPFEQMIEDTDGRQGDFRRVPPQVWSLFETWYGGGPPISFDGPPAEDTRRWTLHVYKTSVIEKQDNIVDLLARVERPDDLVHDLPAPGAADGQARISVKLQGGRKPTVAEMLLLSRAGDFNDGGEDLLEQALSVIEDEDEEDEGGGDEGGGEEDSEGEGGTFPPLTSSVLQRLNFGESVGAEDMESGEKTAEFQHYQDQKSNHSSIVFTTSKSESGVAVPSATHAAAATKTKPESTFSAIAQGAAMVSASSTPAAVPPRRASILDKFRGGDKSKK